MNRQQHMHMRNIQRRLQHTGSADESADESSGMKTRMEFLDKGDVIALNGTWGVVLNLEKFSTNQLILVQITDKSRIPAELRPYLTNRRRGLLEITNNIVKEQAIILTM